MTLTELACELNTDLKNSTTKLTHKVCFDEIRSQVSGASKMTNLQLLILATIASSKSEFQEKVFIEFLDASA